MAKRVQWLLFVVLVGLANLGTIVVSSSPAMAQSAATTPDYEEWDSVAQRAEGVLEDRRASNTAMAGLRAEIAEWRTQFQTAEANNESRIATVKAQQAALGAVPEDGTTEPSEITERRTELAQQLSRLQAPSLTAVEAFSRADGIVSEIDAILRERQADRLTTLTASPINPAGWSEATRAIRQTTSSVGSELGNAYTSAVQNGELRGNLAKAMLYLVAGIVLLGRGLFWMEKLTSRVQGHVGTARRNAQGLMISLAQIAVPVAGIYALSEAFFSTQLVGFRGQIILQALPLLGLCFFGARWLSSRLLPRKAGRDPLLHTPRERHKELRFDISLVGLVVGLRFLLGDVSAFESYSETTIDILAFPLLLIIGVLMVRIGLVLHRAQKRDVAQNNSESDTKRILVSLMARALIVVGVAGPVAAAIGYTTAADFFVYGTVLSAALLGALMVAQTFVRDVYNWLINAEDPTSMGLIPLLIGFVILLGSVPLFALIWGARTSDLTELWSTFMAGFTIGDSKISPTDFLMFVIVFVVGYALTRLLQRGLKTSVLPKTNMDIGGQTAIVSGIGYVGIFLAALVAISTAGLDLSSLAIVAGALSVGIGFGLQNIVSNFVSGIILLIERPIAEGDWIEVGGKMGYVRDISVRSTRIETFDRTDLIVPNADLVSGTVTNYTRGNLIGRAIIPVGVAYGTDTRQVETILQEIANDHPMVTLNPPPSVHFIGFGADSMDFEIRAILRDVNYTLTVKTDMNHEIVRRFAKAGIEIPFAQRDVWLRNPEALQPQATKPKPKSKGPAK